MKTKEPPPRRHQITEAEMKGDRPNNRISLYEKPRKDNN